MKVFDTLLPAVKIIEPRVFEDGRGFFYESFNHKAFEAAVKRSVQFVQDNHSRSGRHVLRGLHYQVHQPQGKLIRVIQGEIFDVAVDIRKGSPTWGQWVGETLSAENKRQMWVPEGFAHAFLVTSETAECLYKTTAYYAPEHERSIRWDDPAIGIRWPLNSQPVLSGKDEAASSLALAEPVDVHAQKQTQ